MAATTNGTNDDGSGIAGRDPLLVDDSGMDPSHIAIVNAANNFVGPPSPPKAAAWVDLPTNTGNATTNQANIAANSLHAQQAAQDQQHQDALNALYLQQDALQDQLFQAQKTAADNKAAEDAQLAVSQAALQEQKDNDLKNLILQSYNNEVTQQANNAQLATAHQALLDSETAQANQLKLAQDALKAQQTASDAALGQARQQAQTQATFMQAQLDQANKLYDQQTQATNRANQLSPDTGAIAKANVERAQQGQSSTMLTGPTGVDLSQLLLGKTSLLGS